MATQVEQYALSWHPQKGTAFRIKLVGGSWSNWNVVSPSELAALALIFNQQPVFVQPDNSITTGPEPIGS